MKYSLILIFILCLFQAPICAQEQIDTTGDIDIPDTVRPLPTCPSPAPPVAIIEAQTVESVGPVIRASGNVLFRYGNYRITAQNVEFNTQTQTGFAREVTFTTCELPNPDYKIRAREISLLPNNKIRAKGVGVYLGSFRVLALPVANFRMGGGAATRNIFPRIGYDADDGLTIAQEFRLIDTDRARSNLDLRVTTRSSVQGNLDGRWGLDGQLVELPGRSLTYSSLRSRVLRLPDLPAADCNPQSLRPVDAARLRAYGIFSFNQRTYDVKENNLNVYRQPELGLMYLGHQLNVSRQKLDPRLEIYPQMVASWGRFRETPGMDNFIGRTSIGFLAPVNILPLGNSLSVQPMLRYNYSDYGDGDSFTECDYAIDVAKILSNGTFASARYIKRNSSGETPFEFDDIDIREEFQTALQARIKRHILGLVLSYDFDKNEVYEWQAMYGHRTDCLAWAVIWNERLQRLSFDVSLINK